MKTNLNAKVFRKIDFHNHIYILEDPCGDQMVESMDHSGIEHMVVHACDTGIWDYCAGNKEIIAAIKEHPDRFTGTVYLDFRLPVTKCVDLIKMAADEGLKGAKMFPNLGFYPDEPRHDTIYEELAKHHFFAAYHMGFLELSNVDPKIAMSTKYARPFFLEEVAVKFPEIDFVICHMGGVPGMEETLVVTRNYKNIYADLAPGYGIEAFKRMGTQLDLVCWEKFMWGLDCRGPKWKKNVDFWQENSTELKYEDKLNLLFYENAARFLEKYGK